MSPTDESARLLSLVSHELRGPLGVLRGYLRLLDQQPDALTPQQRLAVSAALRASDRCSDVATQAGALARLRRGDTTLPLTRTSLAPVLARVSELVPVPDDPPIQLEVSRENDATVACDGPALIAALVSLATCVVRAQTQPTVLSLSCQPADDPGTGALVRLLARPAATLTQTPLDVGRGGMGMELPIADAIIRSHGGHVTEMRAQQLLAGFVLWLPSAPDA